MTQGLKRLGDNKLATAACVVLVLVLTGLGVWTNKTAERQTTIEREVRVQHTEVVQALCNQPFTKACLRRAVNIVKTCLADRGCAELLAARSIPGPDISRGQAESEFRVENPGSYGTRNSSQENQSGGEKSPPDPGSGGGKAPGGKKGKSSPPPEGQPPPSPPPAVVEQPAQEEEGGTVPGQGKGPDGEGPPAKGVQGVIPGAVESVEGIVECAAKADLGCTLGKVGVPGVGGR